MTHRATRMIAPLLIACALSASAAVLAQDRDRDRNQERDPVADRDRVRDRDQDRIADRDRLQDRDQDRLQERDADRAREQDRLQLHVQDRDQLRNRDIYGYELMTRQERREYRARIDEMNGVREWARYRAEHQARMMARAREQGVDLPPPLYGQQLMTDQERMNLRERLRGAASAQERERIRAEHREQMQARARANQVPLTELEQ